MKSKIVLIILILSLVGTAPRAKAQESTGSISFTPSAIPEIGFEYNPAEYQFELTWKSYYLNIKPFAIYQGEYYDLKTIIPWLKNNYPNVDYRTAADKFKNYHRWGFWLEKLPQNVADNLDYLGFDVSDTNIPLSAVEVETIEDGPFPFKRIHIGGRFSIDFYDLYERGFEVTLNRTTILIGNVKGKTDLDLDPITYAAPVITVVGTNGGSDWTFWDIWNASNVNGWGVVHNNQLNNTQYQYDATIIIGNGIDNTVFTDENIQIFINETAISTNWEKWFDVKTKAIVTWGKFPSPAQFTDEYETFRGISIISPVSYNYYLIYCTVPDSNGYMDIFSSHFSGSGASTGYIYRANKIYNCIFSDNLMPMSTYGLVYNIIVTEGANAISSPYGGARNIRCFGTSSGFSASGVGDYLIRDSILYGVSRLGFISNGYSGDTALINVKSYNWLFQFDGVSTGEIYRNYTLKIKIIEEQGEQIYDADVLLTYSGRGGGTAYTGTTPVNGSIPEQIISKGFYNQTGGNTIYPYEPYNLTISKSGYESTILIFNVSEPIDWTIALVEESIDVIVNQDMVLFIFVGLSLITFIGMLIAKNLVISVCAAALSFICWGVTVLVYLYDNYAFPGPALLFGLFAVIALLYTVYAGMKLLNPYERERLEEI